jgi:hypothetical protein
MLGLAGDWPGALFAQQVFRHKHRKQVFRQVSWITVILNCGALGLASFAVWIECAANYSWDGLICMGPWWMKDGVGSAEAVVWNKRLELRENF